MTPIAVGIDIDTVISARGMPIDQDLELHRLAVWSRPHDQMQIPRMEAVDYSSVGLRETASCPPTQSPVSAHWLRASVAGAL